MEVSTILVLSIDISVHLQIMLQHLQNLQISRSIYKLLSDLFKHFLTEVQVTLKVPYSRLVCTARY